MILLFAHYPFCTPFFAAFPIINVQFSATTFTFISAFLNNSYASRPAFQLDCYSVVLPVYTCPAQCPASLVHTLLFFGTCNVAKYFCTPYHSFVKTRSWHSLYWRLGSSSHHSLHFLSSYSPPSWSLKFLYPLAYPHVPRLSPLVFYGHGEIIQVFDSVPFISQFKALLISSARLASRRLFPQLLRQTPSFKKGLLSVNTSQWSNTASPLTVCWSSSKQLSLA